MTMEEATAIIAQELTLAYMQSARPMSKDTLLIVAASLAKALQFNDEKEIRESFRRAKDIADIPTQRVLKEALTNHRRENIPQPKPERTLEDNRPGKKLVTNGETSYMMSLMCVRGDFPYINADKAREYVEWFESDPKNREMVTWYKGWLEDWYSKRSKK